MKIAELIKIPLFSGMNLIAGENGKNHEVDTINMMDAPDIVHFLKPNELLVTTAYHLKDQPHLLKDLVRSMAAAGCAGLGVKTKRFLQEIPGDTILLANELEFPIIELPLELSLGAIVHEILRAILDQRAGEIRYALEIHKQFTNLILDGKGIHTLLVKLSEMIGYPIVLLDRFLKIKKPDLPNQNSSTLVKQLLENNVPFPTGYSSFITFSLCKTKKTYSIFSINISKENFGFLVILGQIEQRDQLSILTIEQAANVIAFSFMQEIAVKQSQRRIRNEFFLNFTNGAFSSQEEVINRAKEFSLNNEQPYICAVGTFDGGETKNHFSHYQKMDLLFEFLEEEAFEAPFPVHLFTQGSLCILLFGANGVTGENTSMVEAALKQMQAKIIYHFHKTASFGLSTICQNFLDVKNAFTEAVHAFHEGQLAKKSNSIYTYQTKDVIELLRTIPKDDLLNFYSYVMQGFSDIEPDEGQSLLETLFIYLESNCQISETAKRLFVHRNTVVYRLKKCERLLGKSLKDAETTLQIRLAFRIKSLLNL